MNNQRTVRFLIFLILSTLIFSGCSMLPQPVPTIDMPPILTQEELIRPYIKLGRIRITREVFGIADYVLTPAIREWGFNAVRAEAAKMGADAVILPEVTGQSITYLVIPSTEYQATGIAIKFK